MYACPGFWDKLIFQLFQGSVGPVLRWGGKYYMGLVENVIFFSNGAKIEKIG